MNKSILAVITLLYSLVACDAKSIEVVDASFDGAGSMSFVVPQGDVKTQVTVLLKRLYPMSEVVFRHKISGFLPADIEISGANPDQIAIEMLAGLGLSACIYQNNVIEVGKFKRRGLCPSAKLPNDKYPDLEKKGRGILTATNGWYGNFQGSEFEQLVTNGQVKAYAASYSPENIGPKVNGESFVNAPGEMTDQQMVDNGVVEEAGVKFLMRPGPLGPQVSELVSKLDNAPQLVWELDDNVQWFNEIEIKRGDYIEIFAEILESYDAFADVYKNNVIVVRGGDK